MKARVWRAAGVMAIAVGLFCVQSPPASAGSLYEELSELVLSHKRIRAAQMDMGAAREQIEVSRGNWYPDLDVTAHIGPERQNKGQGVADTDMVSRQIDVKVTQLLSDFGGSRAGINRSRLTSAQSRQTLKATEQALLLEGVSAHLQLINAAQIVKFARGSVANIKRQTELEDARVMRGSGFSTDVLQAKTQLAGAQARLVQAEGDLAVARNRYKTVFGKPAGDAEGLVKPRLPVDSLPQEVDEAVRTAFEKNPELAAAHLAAEIARQDVKSARADGFFPTLNAVAQHKYKLDVDGTVGSQAEQILKVELNYNFDLGFTAVNTLRASRLTHSATASRFGDSRDLIEEQVRNAWQDLETAKANAEHLLNQANIAGEFLELARKERQLGRRSLIDVLAGETALINASSDAASAETDVSIAAFTLLASMGILDIEIFRQ